MLMTHQINVKIAIYGVQNSEIINHASIAFWKALITTGISSSRIQ